MDHFTPAPLSSSGKPILYDGEVEIFIEPDVSIYVDKNKECIYRSCIVVLSNFRLLSILMSSSGASIGWGLDLSSVASVEDDKAFFLSRISRIRINFVASDALSLIYELDNRSKRRDQFLTNIRRALEKKSWDQPVGKEEKAAFTTSNAGVGGLLRRQERDISNLDSLSKEALSDLDALMKSAKEVINAVQRFAVARSSDTYRIEDKNIGNASSKITEEVQAVSDVSEIESILQNIGIVSPVTKFSAGRLYHTELSKQLADVLLKDGVLEKLGGMLTLTDAYCLFNRARGTELVSPEDFSKAARMIGILNVGIRMKEFRSGLIALQLDSMDDASIRKRLLSIVKLVEYQNSGIDASIAANRLKIGFTLAREQLLDAERAGVLCRDESVHGLYFYQNLF